MKKSKIRKTNIFIIVKAGALSGMAGGLVSAWLMYDERRNAGPSSNLIATFWTIWYWLGLMASLVTAAAALWFYIRRARAP